MTMVNNGSHIKLTRHTQYIERRGGYFAEDTLVYTTYIKQDV